MKTIRSTIAPLGALVLVLGSIAAAQPAPQPAQAPLVPHFNQSMVRFVHVAPSAEPMEVFLSDAFDTVAIAEFADVEYLDATEYIPILAGSYDLTINVQTDYAEGIVTTPVHRLDLIGGQYYTVALTGLAVPTAPTGAQEGFLAWLEGLFTQPHEDLALRTIVIDDMVGVAIAPTEAEVRIAHTAPGTDAIDLVYAWNGTVDVLDTVAYGQVSLFNRIVPTAGRLQARIAGSDVVVVDFTEVARDPGMIHTLFLTGTPVEDVPIEGLAVSTPWTAAQAIPPGAPGAVAPAAGMISVNEVAWVRDHLIQVEGWLDTIGQRLTTTMADPAVTEEQIAAALAEVEHAMMLVAEARAQLELAVPPGVAPAQPVQPGAPAAPPTAPPADPEDEDEAETEQEQAN